DHRRQLAVTPMWNHQISENAIILFRKIGDLTARIVRQDGFLNHSHGRGLLNRSGKRTHYKLHTALDVFYAQRPITARAYGLLLATAIHVSQQVPPVRIRGRLRSKFAERQEGCKHSKGRSHGLFVSMRYRLFPFITSTASRTLFWRPLNASDNTRSPNSESSGCGERRYGRFRAAPTRSRKISNLRATPPEKTTRSAVPS